MIRIKLLSLLLILSSLSFLSCSESNPSSADPKPEPSLTLSQSEIDFLGKDSVAVLVISAHNTDSINWFVDSRRYFVTVEPTSGVVHRSNSDSISVTVHRSGVPYGVQYAVFDLIQLPDSIKTSVAISMEVLPPTPPSPDISVNRLDFPSEISRQTFILSNSGEQLLNWTVDTITDGRYGHYDHVRSSIWLSIEPFSGQLSQGTETLSVSIDRTNLLPGLTTGQLWINTSVDTFKIITEATVGTKIWACSFNSEDAFTDNWTGNWHPFGPYLAGETGSRMQLKPEAAPFIEDIHDITVQCKTSPGFYVPQDIGAGRLYVYIEAKIGNSYTLGSTEVTTDPYRYTAWVPSNKPDKPSGPLALEIYLTSNQNDDHHLALYSVEIWRR